MKGASRAAVHLSFAQPAFRPHPHSSTRRPALTRIRLGLGRKNTQIPRGRGVPFLTPLLVFSKAAVRLAVMAGMYFTFAVDALP